MHKSQILNLSDILCRTRSNAQLKSVNAKMLQRNKEIIQRTPKYYRKNNKMP
jgi:hypothetical protein